MPQSIFPSTHTYSFLALGDSYTIGESVLQQESFPYQLKEMLTAGNIAVANPVIIARTGWTTDELIDAIRDQKPAHDYDIVTLLIGVNNQYRGYNTATYRKEFKMLLQTAVACARGDKRRVFVVSIPDWGVTPFGKSSRRDINTIAAEIDMFNRMNKEETMAMDISYTDITPGSRNADKDATLVAGDGLHPSGKMYGEWVKALTPKILQNLK